MFKSLNTAMLGIRATCIETLDLAKRHNFGGVDLDIREARNQGIHDLKNQLAAKSLRPGVAGGLLPGRLIGPKPDWDTAMAALPELSAFAKAAGFTRTTIVMLPFDDALSFKDCLALSIARLRQAANLLGDFGISVGIEYVAQATRRAGKENHFIYDLAGSLGLIDAVGAPNVGMLLDSFHWHCAGESVTALRALPASRIVATHMADAPNRPLAEQVAFERELPGAGVADLRGFCAAVRSTGYDGPIACEPFCKAFETMPADTVAQRVSAAMDTILD